MKSSKTLKLGAVSLAVLLSTSAHAISFDELFFDQKAGFDAASLMINVNNPDLVVEFENELSPNGMDPGLFPAGTGDGLFDTMTWEGTDDPGDPSMLNIQSFTDDDSPTSDGAWGANEWWTITRLTATNNVIFDFGLELWQIDFMANLGIFSGSPRGPGNEVLRDINSVNSLIYDETFNLDCPPPNPIGSTCDDIYRTSIAGFSPLGFSTDDHDYRIDFRLVGLNGAEVLIDQQAGEIQVYTPEIAPGVSMVDIQMQWVKIPKNQVPNPGSLALMSLGLLLVGGRSLRRRLGK